MHGTATPQDVFHRRMPPCTLLTFGDPPPISRLCHRRFGFRRSFAPLSLSRRGARPTGDPSSSSLEGMMGRAPFVDFCNRCTAPRAQLRNRPNSAPPPPWSPNEAASSGHSPKAGSRSADGHRGISGGLAFAKPTVRRSRFRASTLRTANRDVTGQGPSGTGPQHGSSPGNRLQRELCPNPIGSGTSCRELVRPGLEKPTTSGN